MGHRRGASPSPHSRALSRARPRTHSAPRLQILDKQRGLDPERDVNEDALALEAEAEAIAAAHAEAEAAAAADDEAYAAQQAHEQNGYGGGDVAMGENGDEPGGEDDDPFKEIDDAALAAMDMPDLPQPPLLGDFMGFDDGTDADMLGGGFELPMPPQEFQMGGNDEDEGLVLPQPPPEFL